MRLPEIISGVSAKGYVESTTRVAELGRKILTVAQEMGIDTQGRWFQLAVNVGQIVVGLGISALVIHELAELAQHVGRIDAGVGVSLAQGPHCIITHYDVHRLKEDFNYWCRNPFYVDAPPFGTGRYDEHLGNFWNTIICLPDESYLHIMRTCE